MPRLAARPVSLVAAVLLSAGGGFAAEPPRGLDALGKTVTDLRAEPRFRGATWGAAVVDLGKSEPGKHGAVQPAGGETPLLLEEFPDRFVLPASVTKLFSGGAALVELGPEMRFETPIYATRSWTAEGDLPGDLVLRASGDPTLGGRTDEAGRVAYSNADHTYAGFLGNAELTAPDPLAGLDDLAAQVFKAGIRRVHGDVLIDARLFAPYPSSGSGPGRVLPISLNDNLLDFTLVPTTVGEFAKVVVRPENAWFTIDAQVATAPAGEPPRMIVQVPDRRTVLLRGRIPVDAKPLVTTAEVPDPPAFARALWIERLRKHGVALEASAFREPADDRLPPLDVYRRLPPLGKLVSPPFRDHLRLILKSSHNQHANLLPMLLALKHGENRLESGLTRQRIVLAALGVDPEALAFSGGAGGSPADHVTPRATVALLAALARHEHAADLFAALPVLGRDGTLAKAIDPGSPARGKVRAKTGTIVWPDPFNGRLYCSGKALAGYVERDDGGRWAFAVFVSGVPLEAAGGVDDLNKALGRIAEALHAWNPSAAP